MNGTQQILTLHVYSKGESKLKEFLVDETLPLICYTNEYDSKVTTVDKCSTKKDESECVHKNINKQKDAENEAEYD